MPAHTRPRLKDIDPRVTVGQQGQLPDIDTELFADDRQFVGEGNVDVAEAVFGELAHLRRSGVRDNAFVLDEDAVKGDCRVGALRCNETDHAVVISRSSVVEGKGLYEG